MRNYQEQGISRVFVDSREQKETLETVDEFREGEMLAALAGSRLKFAVVVTTDPIRHRFFEDVSVNRGARIRYFESKETALAWLLEE